MRLLLLIAVSAICISASSEARLRPDEGRQEDLAQPGSFCQGCRSIISFISRFNTTTKIQENKELFGKFCEIYYPVSTDFRHGPCPIVVDTFFEGLQLIDPVNYCDNLGACNPDYKPDQLSTLTSSDNVVVGDEGPVCVFCTDFVKQVKDKLDDPRVIDDIHRKVDAFCEYLTVIDADKQCRAALESYIEQALDFLNKIKPVDFCRSIQLCAPESSIWVVSPAKSKNQESLPTLADFNKFGIETTVQIGGQQKGRPMNVLTNEAGKRTPNCLFCKTLIKEMFKFLKNNVTEDNIRYALDRGCDLIYHDKEKRDHCEDLVQAYTKELLELLADETDPQVICTLLDQCTCPASTINAISSSDRPTSRQSLRRTSGLSSSKKSVTMSDLISMLDPTIEVNSMRTCVECKLFFKYLQETLDKPSSQEEIKNWLLKNLCAELDDRSLVESCSKFIDQESAVFFQALVENLNPKRSCEQLGACSARIRSDYISKLQHQAATRRKVATSSIQTDSFVPCDQCIQIVTKIDDYLSTHPIDHDITVLKVKVCSSIQDDNIRLECIMVIQTLGQEIIQAISNMDNPRQLCQKIKSC